MIIGQENSLTIPQIDRTIAKIDQFADKAKDERTQEEMLSYKKRLLTAKNRILRYYARAKVKFPALTTKKNILTVLSITAGGKFSQSKLARIAPTIGKYVDMVKQGVNAGIDFLEDNKGLIVGTGATAAVIALSKTALGKKATGLIAKFVAANPAFAWLVAIIGATYLLSKLPSIRSHFRKQNASVVARQQLKAETMESMLDDPENSIMNILDGSAKDEKGQKITAVTPDQIEQIENNPELLNRLKEVFVNLEDDDPKKAKLGAILRQVEQKRNTKQHQADVDYMENNKQSKLNAYADQYVKKEKALKEQGLQPTEDEIEQALKDKNIQPFDKNDFDKKHETQINEKTAAEQSIRKVLERAIKNKDIINKPEALESVCKDLGIDTSSGVDVTNEMIVNKIMEKGVGNIYETLASAGIQLSPSDKSGIEPNYKKWTTANESIENDRTKELEEYNKKRQVVIDELIEQKKGKDVANDPELQALYKNMEELYPDPPPPVREDGETDADYQQRVNKHAEDVKKAKVLLQKRIKEALGKARDRQKAQEQINEQVESYTN